MQQAQAGLDHARERSSAKVEGVYASVAAAQAQLDQARYYLENTTLVAPEDGRIVNLQVRPGMVSGIFRIGAIASLICDADRYLLASFDQEVLLYVEKGQPAEIALATFPGQIFKGTVEEIWPSGAGQLLPSGTVPDVSTRAAGDAPGPVRREDPLRRPRRREVRDGCAGRRRDLRGQRLRVQGAAPDRDPLVLVAQLALPDSVLSMHWGALLACVLSLSAQPSVFGYVDHDRFHPLLIVESAQLGPYDARTTSLVGVARNASRRAVPSSRSSGTSSTPRPTASRRATARFPVARTTPRSSS